MYQRQKRGGDADREELMGSANAPATRTQYDTSGMSNEQMLQQGLETHKETTASAYRSVQLVEQAKNLAGATAEELNRQGKQLEKVEEDIEKIGQETQYANRMVKYLNSCCLTAFFCSCLTEPERNPKKDKAWMEQGNKYQAPTQEQAMSHPGGKKVTTQANGAAPQYDVYGGPQTDDLREHGYGNQADQIDQETKLQNNYLDQVSRGLTELHDIAGNMNQELKRHNERLENVNDRAEAVNSKVGKVNRDLRNT